MSPDHQPHAQQTLTASAGDETVAAASQRGYEKPRVAVLGTLATLTHGSLGSNTDVLSAGSAF